MDFFKFNCLNYDIIYLGDSMTKNYDINSLVSEINFNDNMLNDYNGLLLTNKEVTVLNRYNIEYSNCTNLSQLLYQIEEILNEEQLEDLEEVSKDIAERNYYHNTNK